MKKRIAFSLALLMLLTLAACGGEAPVTPVLTPEPSPAPTEAPAVTPEPRDFLDWWDGDWYGWWIIGDGTGDYNELDDSWYDAAAHIEVQQDGIASLLLWDEDSDAENPIADVHLFITEEEQSKGLAFSTDGSFYGRSVDWTIDTAEARFESEYVEDLLRIEGTFSDAKGSFTYYIFLRPWGTLWDDVGENLQPHGYAAWYLPLLESGVSTAPNVLGRTEADLPEAP